MVDSNLIIAGLLIWLLLGYVGWYVMIGKNYYFIFDRNVVWLGGFGISNLFIAPTGLFGLLLGLWLPDKEYSDPYAGVPPSKDKLYCHYIRLKNRKVKKGLGFLSVGHEGLTFRSAKPAAQSPDKRIPLLFWSPSKVKGFMELRAYGPKIPKYECFIPFSSIQDAQLLTRDLVPKELHIRHRMVGRSKLVLQITREDKEQEDEYFWSHAKYFRGVINKELISRHSEIGGTVNWASKRSEKRNAYPAPSKEYGDYEK